MKSNKIISEIERQEIIINSLDQYCKGKEDNLEIADTLQSLLFLKNRLQLELFRDSDFIKSDEFMNRIATINGYKVRIINQISNL